MLTQNPRRRSLSRLTLFAAIAFSGSLLQADSIINLSALSHGSDYQYPPNPLFNPRSINNAGQVLGTFGYNMSGQGTTAYFAEIYSNGTVTNIGGGLTEGGWILTNLNNNGQAVGYAFYRSLETAAVEDTGSGVQWIGPNGMLTPYSVAYGINDSGEVVGSSVLNGGAFLYANGNLINIGSGTAYGINNSGEVAAIGTSGLYTYLNGQVTNLNSAVPNASSVAGINGSGAIAGNAASGFLYVNGVLTVISGLGGAYNDVTGLNDLGQVVGCSGSSKTNTDAYLYSNGVATDLNSLLPSNSGWDLTCASGINDSGQIIGTGTFDGQTAGFLLDTETASAAPEPSTTALFAIGSATLLVVFIKRKNPLVKPSTVS
jgi:probable HAF family extracellular repeat protein